MLIEKGQVENSDPSETPDTSDFSIGLFHIRLLKLYQNTNTKTWNFEKKRDFEMPIFSTYTYT